MTLFIKSLDFVFGEYKGSCGFSALVGNRRGFARWGLGRIPLSLDGQHFGLCLTLG